MRSKEIGHSAEYYLLHEILAKLEQITRIAPNVDWGGGGTPTTTITTTSTPTTTTTTTPTSTTTTTTTTAWNPFTQITNWTFALNAATAQADLASGSPFWGNSSLASPKDGNALVANGTPSWDAANNGVLFVKPDNERFTVQAQASYGVPRTVIFRYRTPSAWLGSAHTMAGFSSTHRVAQAATTGVLTISGVSTGVAQTVNTEYMLIVVINGASSTFQLNNGAVTGISLSTNAIGTPNWRLGANSADGEHWAGVMHYMFIYPGALSAGQLTNMWAAPILSGY